MESQIAYQAGEAGEFLWGRIGLQLFDSSKQLSEVGDSSHWLTENLHQHELGDLSDGRSDSIQTAMCFLLLHLIFFML